LRGCSQFFLIASAARKNRWSNLDVPRHVFHFTPETLKYVLESADYSVLHIDHFSVEFNPIGVLQTVLNCLGLEPGFIYGVVKYLLGYS
jgi:hypothetical protein